MSKARPKKRLKKELFLRNQVLSQLDLDDPEQQHRYLFGEGKADELAAKESHQDLWKPRTRAKITTEAASAKAPPRVILMCDAGRGKTVNMERLQAAIAREPGGRQLPFLWRLDLPSQLEDLKRAVKEPQFLLNWMAGKIVLASDEEECEWARYAIRKKRSEGLITFLIDGLDHVLGEEGFVQKVFDLVGAHPWNECPVWISGRPEAFRKWWTDHFTRPLWRILRVEALAWPESRYFMDWNAGHDWYSAFPAGSRALLATPRLLKHICDVLRREIPMPPSNREERRQAITQLSLDTAAGVYWRSYFHVDSENNPDSHGLLAQGLAKRAHQAGAAQNLLEMPGQVRDLGLVLGAVAFYTFSLNSRQEPPVPYTGGVPYDELVKNVGPMLQALGLRALQQFKDDVELLRQMNNHSLEFLIFNNDPGDSLLAFHSRTVLTFFAAYWAMKFGTADDLRLMGRWITGGKGERLEAFDEFWTFAAEMPDKALKSGARNPAEDWQRWMQVFGPCFTPPAKLTGQPEWVQWHRRMIYHSFRLMRERDPKTIAAWRTPTADQAAIVAEIKAGLCDIEPGPCHYQAEPAENRQGRLIQVRDGFRLHQWPVTNRMYEAFDPAHRAERWKNQWKEEEHPLAGVAGREGQDWCPVVNVSWFDAWCFAAWCGDDFFLPSELQWEHACRKGTAWNYYFSDDEDELKKHAWYDNNSGGHSHPVPLENSMEHRNANGLYDMHGNVWEWCADWYNAEASARVLRGGCWIGDGGGCRSACRDGIRPDYRIHDYGFRLAAVPRAVGAKQSKRESVGDAAASAAEPK